MKDIRIVIVSWNVAHLLDRCLRSLSSGCEGLAWECVVVDNASADSSVRVARDISPNIHVIANTENVGFAKACNQGAASSDARYILFLNPDTECPVHSIQRLVELADTRPNAGIIGPKLVYSDGTNQQSIRRFPGVWDQLGILLKLSHVFRTWGIFKNYFADDVDQDTEQCVDQVMGACFLVRRELVDAHLGWDERYFIWMEDVDFCKTAIEAGYEVRYLPSISIIHHGGQSFSQVFTYKKQKYFTDSLKKYFAKWHIGWQSCVISCAIYPALALSWGYDMWRTNYGKWITGIIFLECVSLATIFHPVANTIACIIAGVFMCICAYKKPHIALSILALELIIGSKGYLLQFGGWPSHISLRMILTLTFLLGWGLASGIRVRSKSLTPYIAVSILCITAVLNGIRAGYTDVFHDANAWVELVLLIPIWDIASRYKKEIRSTIIPVLITGIVWLAIKSLIIELAFSHSAPHLGGVYLWIRRTGIGEITKISGAAYRIFFQSSVYFIPAYFFAVAYTWSQKNISSIVRWLIILSTAGLVLGLSRSFFVGFIFGITLLGILLIKKYGFSFTLFWSIVQSTFFGCILTISILFLPIPGLGSASPFDILESRLNNSAVQSRWELLSAMKEAIVQSPLYGYGFGKTLTYHAFDPRLATTGQANAYTTYAFEWGWLDFWIKFGIVGIPVMLWVLFSVSCRIWRSKEEEWMRYAAVSSILALGILHMFTPYLNHPLGFLFLFLGEGMILSSYYEKI